MRGPQRRAASTDDGRVVQAIPAEGSSFPARTRPTERAHVTAAWVAAEALVRLSCHRRRDQSLQRWELILCLSL